MRKLFAALFLALAAVTGTAPAAHADKPTDVVVEDTAGVLDLNALLPAVNDVEFYEPTKVAIYTRSGDPSDNFNEEVLAYAREEHPDWLSPDGQKWADGLYLFALDPMGRQVGTYMGEDRKVSLDERTKIQESTFDLLRDAQWTDGTIQGIEAGARIINRPWYRSPLFIGGVCVGGVLSVLGIGTALLVHRQNLKAARKAITEGDASFSSVTTDLDATELNAHTIPADSSYGAKILAEHRSFRSRYEQATELGNTVHSFTDKELRKGKNRREAERYAALAGELDDFDDVISDTNALLNRAPGWESAWDRQTAPLKEDLAELDSALAGHLDSSSGQLLLAFRPRAERALREWEEGLAGGTLSPEEALDRLRETRQELTTLLSNHAETVIGAFARDSKEEEMMRGKMQSAYRPRRRRGIIDNAYPAYTFITVGSFNQGYSSAQSSVTSARESASSSTGYGSSGGSFSGSGSSSRF